MDLNGKPVCSGMAVKVIIKFLPKLFRLKFHYGSDRLLLIKSPLISVQDGLDLHVPTLPSSIARVAGPWMGISTQKNIFSSHSNSAFGSRPKVDANRLLDQFHSRRNFQIKAMLTPIANLKPSEPEAATLLALLAGVLETADPVVLEAVVEAVVAALLLVVTTVLGGDEVDTFVLVKMVNGAVTTPVPLALVAVVIVEVSASHSLFSSSSGLPAH